MAFRYRIALIIAVSAVALLAVIGVTLVTGRLGNAQLTGIQDRYLPEIELERDLKQLFTKTVRALEDAASAADEGKLAEADSAHAEFLARTASGAQTIRDNGGNPAVLASELDSWFKSARAISAEIVAGKPGGELVGQVEHMRMVRRQFSTLLDKAVAPDRRALAEAFSSARASQTASLWLDIGVAALALAVMGVLSWRLIVRTVSTLRAVSEGVEKLASGELDHPIPVASDDELGALAREANRTAVRLREYRERIEATNRELEAFSYSVSHDLRAPLRGIDRFSQALVEDHEKELSEPAQDYLRRVRAAAKRMSELIEDLLRLSRLTRAELKRSDVDLSALAGQIVAELRRAEPARQVEVEIAPGVTASADRDLVRIVLENLIGNAWKFTGKTERGRIEVGRGDDGYFVRDNGAGFDMAHGERLFAPFQRLHADKDFPGTGVGLATVQRIVQRHGGKIWAESEVGKGATFRFTLPG